MLVLNLVSEELKKEIKLRHLYQLIKKVNYLIIIITIITAIVLLVAKVILQNNFNKIVEQTTLVTINNQSYNSKIREINSKLKFIANIQNEFVAWSKIVNDLSIMTPSNITFYRLNFDLATKTVKINGKAGERSGLLELKDNLEKSGNYSDIQFPLKNILEKENINFEINAKLNI